MLLRRLVVAHGYTAHPQKHWFPWLKAQLEPLGVHHPYVCRCCCVCYCLSVSHSLRLTVTAPHCASRCPSNRPVSHSPRLTVTAPHSATLSLRLTVPLGVQVIIPALPNTEAPVLEQWVEALTKVLTLTAPHTHSASLSLRLTLTLHHSHCASLSLTFNMCLTAPHYSLPHAHCTSLCRTL